MLSHPCICSPQNKIAAGKEEEGLVQIVHHDIQNTPRHERKDLMLHLLLQQENIDGTKFKSSWAINNESSLSGFPKEFHLLKHFSPFPFFSYLAVTELQQICHERKQLGRKQNQWRFLSVGSNEDFNSCQVSYSMANCVSVTSQRLENWKNRLYIILTTQV